MSKGIRVGTAHQVVVRAVQVADVEPLGTAVRRVVLTGPDLVGVTMPDGFRLAPMQSSGFDDRLLVILPGPDGSPPVLPVQGRGRIEHRPDRQVGLRRSYTVRRWDPETTRLTLDFVLHGHGPAAAWAASCKPGDRLHVLGPGNSHGAPDGVDWLLIAGDETALPAIARWLEEMAQDTIADVFIEVDGPAQAIEIVHPTGASVTWLYRLGRPAADSTLLEEAVRSLPSRAGTGFAWVAAEAGVVRPIRHHLRNERRLPRDHVEVAGYWRRDASEDDESDHEHEEHGHDEHGHDEHDDEVAGLAGRLDRCGLFPHGVPVRIHGPGARRIRHELAACRPDLLFDAPGRGVTLLQLEDDSPAASVSDAIGEAMGGPGDPDTVLVVVPAEQAERLPPSLAGAVRHELDWLGEVLVLDQAVG